MSELTPKEFFEREDPLYNKNYPAHEVETFLFDERDMMIFAERYYKEKIKANEATTSHDKALDIDLVSVLSDLKEWCFDNCNASNSDRLHEILDRLDKR